MLATGATAAGDNLSWAGAGVESLGGWRRSTGAEMHAWWHAAVVCWCRRTSTCTRGDGPGGNDGGSSYGRCFCPLLVKVKSTMRLSH